MDADFWAGFEKAALDRRSYENIAGSSLLGAGAGAFMGGQNKLIQGALLGAGVMAANQLIAESIATRGGRAPGQLARMNSGLAGAVGLGAAYGGASGAAKSMGIPLTEVLPPLIGTGLLMSGMASGTTALGHEGVNSLLTRRNNA